MPSPLGKELLLNCPYLLTQHSCTQRCPSEIPRPVIVQFLTKLTSYSDSVVLIKKNKGYIMAILFCIIWKRSLRCPYFLHFTMLQRLGVIPERRL